MLKWVPRKSGTDLIIWTVKYKWKKEERLDRWTKQKPREIRVSLCNKLANSFKCMKVGLIIPRAVPSVGSWQLEVVYCCKNRRLTYWNKKITIEGFWHCTCLVTELHSPYYHNVKSLFLKKNKVCPLCFIIFILFTYHRHFFHKM